MKERKKEWKGKVLSGASNKSLSPHSFLCTILPDEDVFLIDPKKVLMAQD